MTRTRLLVPRTPAHVLDRPRLAGLVADLARCPLALVRAPAGSGKTVLLTQWQAALAGDALTGWLSFDSADIAPGDAIAAVAAMIGCPQPATADAICDHLLDEARPTFLFLDNADQLPLPALHALFDLVGRLPPDTHVILASRRRLPLPVARLRVQGALLEVDATALAFTAEEADALLPPGDTADALRSAMVPFGGWAAGLGLLARAGRGGSRGIPAAVARDANTFLKEEAFDPLADELKDFLIATCLLGQLSPSLCDAVTGRTDSGEILVRLHDNGSFLDHAETAPDQWIIAPAFAEFLRDLAAGDAKRCASVHRAAARWFASREFYSKALEHMSLASDPVALADLLEEHCDALINKIMVVARFAGTLPPELIAERPKILMTLAWLNTRQLQFQETRRLLDLAARRIGELEGQPSYPRSELRMLRLMLRHGELALSTARDDMTDVRENGRMLLEDLGDTRSYLTTSVYSQMAAAQCHQYRIGEFDELEHRARTALAQSAGRLFPVGLPAATADGLFAAGRSAEAAMILEQALDRAARLKGSPPDVAGTVALIALPFAKILYERNDLDRAGELVARYLPAVRFFGNADQLIAGYLTAARLAQVAGDTAGAFDTLDRGLRVAAECGLERLTLMLSAEKIQIHLRTAHPDEAIAIGASIGVRMEDEPLDPRSEATVRKEIRAFVWSRLAQSQGRVPEAILLAKRWRSFCSSRGAVAALIRWQVLLAQLHVVAGQHGEAQRSLQHALTSAAPGHFVRSIVDEGPAIHRLLIGRFTGVADMPGASTRMIDTFVRTVLAAFGTNLSAASIPEEDGNEGLYGRLTAKELEILVLVGRGLRNREIGGLLGLTEGTVKWYMQQIYDKMGVRRRPQAVEKARQFGLLS